MRETSIVGYRSGDKINISTVVKLIPVVSILRNRPVRI